MVLVDERTNALYSISMDDLATTFFLKDFQENKASPESTA